MSDARTAEVTSPVQHDDPTAGTGGEERKSRTPFLTAVGSLLTSIVAIGGIWLHAMDAGTPQPPPQPPSQPVIVLPQPAAAPPAVEATAREVGTGRTTGVLSGHVPAQQSASDSGDASEIVTEWQATLNGQERATADRCANGSSTDCATTLQILVAGCDQGYPLDCDTLYLVSPSGSDLETYGNTCGGRVSDDNDSWCRDLAS